MPVSWRRATGCADLDSVGVVPPVEGGDRLSGSAADRAYFLSHNSIDDFPGVEDGARAVKFIEAAAESSRAQGAWTDCALQVCMVDG